MSKGSAAELLVGTASDLAPAEAALSSSFQKLTGNRVRFVLAASGVIARQVKAGAPFDAVLLANIAYVTDLAKETRVDPASVRVFAVGRLGFWSPKGFGWADLTRPEIRHIALANPSHAPYGAAAKAALERAGQWSRLQSKLVYGENVRQALQYAESGNADVVLTAWSLVKDKGGALVDARLHPPVEQGAGIVARRPNEALARRFLEFLCGPEGQAILERYGFERGKR